MITKQQTCQAVNHDAANVWGHCQAPAQIRIGDRLYCRVHAEIHVRAFPGFYSAPVPSHQRRATA